MLSRCLARLCTEPQARSSLLFALPVSSILPKTLLVPALRLLKRHCENPASFLSLLFLEAVKSSGSGSHSILSTHPPARESGKTDRHSGEVLSIGALTSCQRDYRVQAEETDRHSGEVLSIGASTPQQREYQWQAEVLQSFNKETTTRMFPFQPQGGRNGIYQHPHFQWMPMNMNAMNEMRQQQQQFLHPNMMLHLGQVVPMQDQLMFKDSRPRGPHPDPMGPRAWNQSPSPRRNQIQQQQQQQQQQQYPQHNKQRNNNKRKSSESASDDRHTSKMGRYQGDSSLNTSNSTAMYMSVVNGVKPIYHVPGQSSCNRITESIVEYYNESHQSEEDLNHKIVLSNCLHCIVKGIFPGCRLFIVGSSLTGFGTHTSDMDLCLLVTQIQQIDQKFEAVHILNAIHKSLRNCTFVKSSQVIKAKVPILKFTDSTKNIECDLNINNGVGIRNTHLLKYYCLADNRVAPLMLFIKFWARFHDINDAHKRTISSYSLALMLIHYLQVCKPPVVPCLQLEFPERFNSGVDLRNLRLDIPLHHNPSENRDSLGQLFQGFLDYYAFSFSPETQVISVRRGCVLDRQLVQRNSQEPHQWKCLCVEEPFDLTNTARSVFDPNIFARVRQVFRRSAEQLRRDRDVYTILEMPF